MILPKTDVVQSALRLLPSRLRSGEPYEALPEPTVPPGFAEGPTLWLRTSPNLIPIPPIDFENCAIIFDGDFATAELMFAAYPSATDYLLVATGGADLRDWGEWTIRGSVEGSGTAERYRTIRAFDVSTDWMHPVDRIGGNEVLIESMTFTAGAAYWMVIGFSNRGMVGDNDVVDGHHIVFARHLVEGQIGNYAFRLRGGDECVVQQSLMRDPALETTPGPTFGRPLGGFIGVNPNPTTGPIAGWKSLDNEVRNYIDGLLQGRNNADPFMECSGRSEGNDYYITDYLYQGVAEGLSWAENGLDFKSGSDATTTVSHRDRIWGMRKTTGTGGAAGDGVEIHRQARNLRFEMLFVDDCAFGFHETGWDSPTDPETPRLVEFDDCQFTRIKAYAPHTGAGSVFRHFNNTDVHDCWFRDSEYVHYVPAALRAGGPTMVDNTKVGDITTAHPDSVSNPYVEGDNATVTFGTIQRIQCQRWTGGGTTFRLGAKVTDTIDFREPLSKFTAGLTVGTVQIEDESEAYDGATITDYLTSWGDGTADSTAAEPSHVYAANGIYTITRTVTDSNALTHTTQRNVWVTGLASPLKPRFMTAGAILKTTGGGTPTAPTGCVEGDLLLCWAVTVGTQPATFSAANGFEEIPGSPFDSGQVAGNSVHVSLRRVGAGETSADWAPTFNDPGDHLMAQVRRYDRVRDTVDVLDVIDAIANSYDTSVTTSVVIPGLTTTEDNDLVLGFGTTGLDSDTGDFSSIATAAPHVSNSTTRINEGTTQGNGSGVLLVEGDKPLAGALGGWTATLGTTFRQAHVTIALFGADP